MNKQYYKLTKCTSDLLAKITILLSITVLGWTLSIPFMSRPKTYAKMEIEVEVQGTTCTVESTRVRYSESVSPTQNKSKKDRKVRKPSTKPVNKKIEEVPVNHSTTVLATYYHPVASQCQGDPTVTACGGKIVESKLKNGSQRWVALSRNLLGKYPYKSKIYIHSNNPRLVGIWTVMDTMNKRHTDRIDFLTYVGDDLGMLKPVKVKISKLS